MVDQLADLPAATAAGEGALLPWTPPCEELAHGERRLAAPAQDVAAFLGEFAARSIKPHHPHYVGHQVCASVPAAALTGLAAELLNNGMAVYEMGRAATALELWIVKQTCAVLGLVPGNGFLTSGGTLATLTALLAARGRMLGAEALTRGTDAAWAVLASE